MSPVMKCLTKPNLTYHVSPSPKSLFFTPPRKFHSRIHWIVIRRSHHSFQDDITILSLVQDELLTDLNGGHARVMKLSFNCIPCSLIENTMNILSIENRENNELRPTIVMLTKLPQWNPRRFEEPKRIIFHESFKEREHLDNYQTRVD